MAFKTRVQPPLLLNIASLLVSTIPQPTSPFLRISNHLVVWEGQKIPRHSRAIPTPHQKYSYAMGVEKKIIREGNGVDFPKEKDIVTMEYTGYLYDDSASESKGQK